MATATATPGTETFETNIPSRMDRLPWSRFDREVAAIAQASAEPISRDELARTVRARHWGPGRFRRALGTAEREGRVRRIARDRYQRV
jgi:hypothetical protein